MSAASCAAVSGARLPPVLAPSVISKVRRKRVAVNSELLLAAHELTEISIRDLRDLMGDTHTEYWLGGANAEKSCKTTMKLPGFVDNLRREAQHGTSHV